MEITEEELERLVELRMAAKNQQPAKKQKELNPEAFRFKHEVRDWAMTQSNKLGHTYHLQDSLNSILRFRLGIRTVAVLKDEQVPEARKIFEQYKRLLNSEPVAPAP